MKRVLIVCPSFPPVNSVDQHRVRMAVPHLRKHGWEPVILTVDPLRQADHSHEPLLLDTLPADLQVHRCGALPLSLTSPLGIRNLGLRAWCSAYRHGFRLLRGSRFDLVWFSTTQFALFSLGPRWRRTTGVPYVLDFQDPIWSDAYAGPDAAPPPGGWKYRIARHRGKRLEAVSASRCSGILTVSDEFLNLLKTRHPHLSQVPQAVIPFGYSRSDFEAADRLPFPDRIAKDGLFSVVSIGAAGPLMKNALNTLFSAAAAFKSAEPVIFRRVRFIFIGTRYATDRDEIPTGLGKLAEKHGVADRVTEYPGRIGYLESLRAMRAAGALVILGTNEAGYHPSKLYPCLFAGRPVVALPRSGGALHKTLLNLSHPLTFPFDAEDSIGRIASAFFDMTVDRPAGIRPDIREFAAPALTRRLAGWLDAACEYAMGEGEHGPREAHSPREGRPARASRHSDARWI